MNIHVIGGGPGGVYFSILRMRRDPSTEIHVYERNARDDTFGWGVVFSEATLENLLEADPPTLDEITREYATWDEVDIHYKGEVVRSGGHGFCGIERKRLLQLLYNRAEELGVHLHFGEEVTDFEAHRSADLLIGADGVNSLLREEYTDRFKPSLTYGRAKFIWFGTACKFEAFTFWCAENEHGFFTVHAYQYNDEKSTFIVETDEESWRRAGLDGSTEHAVRYFEELFQDKLGGHPLLTNKSEWINFRRVKNEHWYFDNVVLVGDAASTAHFSIGSGTKLAMEDAICLDWALGEASSQAEALAWYQEERMWFTDRLQLMAEESRVWYEEVKRRRHLDPKQFAYAMMTRNKRLGHDQLYVRDESYIEGVNAWFAERAGVGHLDPPPPPMFTPFKIGPLEVKNRVVVSPMCMYSADDGTVDDWHLVHLGSRAIGGAGLVLTEMTDVSRDGRITPGCAGMYKPEHVPAWKRIVDFVHRWSDAKIGLQIAHAGRKGATKLMWEGIDHPLDEGEWPIVAPSPLPYRPHSQVPHALDRAGMDAIRDDFVRAATMASEAGFDLIEVHMAHGYLLGTFLSPLTNLREDEYGGAIENRMRFPMEVFAAVRAAWGGAMSVRVSAIDWHEDGQKIEDSIALARALKAAGCDIIDVSSGHTDLSEEAEYRRCYQVPFSEQIRFEAAIATMTVGAISRHGEINAILASGCADLCALARPHLFNPYFALHAAAEQEHSARWPDQYGPAQPLPREKLRWFEREKKRKRRRVL